MRGQRSNDLGKLIMRLPPPPQPPPRHPVATAAQLKTPPSAHPVPLPSRVPHEQRLGQLQGAEVVARAEDRGNRKDHLMQLDDSCSAPKTLKLKVGAQVTTW